ncbi:MAG: hypothetical protein DRN29_05075 [Thermoplasmata archaeon]|nr:MAG: hypothetical protein DRN29_05075 [Thermoplasmata archaeon]
MEKRIIIVLALIIAILLLAFSFSEMKGKKKEEMVVSMKIIPSEFTLQEGGSTEIVVELKVNNMPYIAKINWSIESSGNTGKLVFENESVTDSNGILKAEYFAPDDVDEMQQYIKIIARVKIGGHEYFATANATVYPLLYQTLIEVEKEREKIIAGETNILRAKLFANIDGWLPLKNKTIIWKFYANGKEMMVKESKTNGLGISEIPFFYSNAAENVSIVAEAIFERNLSGEIDYEGCHANLSFTVIPEKPGDFPVVLIHGWTGSITDALLNYTWWNLTQKLVANGFKVLDFDVTKPGIQWLTYEPSWFEEHHIPWIAAKVCEKIKEALVLNGYPPNQTIDIVAHSMGGLVARFMAEHYMADVDYWNKDWNGTGYPWYGDGDADITLGPYQIDDLIAVGTPCHGVPPNINESFLRSIIKYAYFPWWMGQVPDMIYDAPFLQAMGYKGTDLVDYYGVGGDIGVIIGDYPVDFDGDGIPHYSDGLCPTESPYLEGKPLYILEGHAWPVGEEDHISLIAINEKVHEYILEHLIL